MTKHKKDTEKSKVSELKVAARFIQVKETMEKGMTRLEACKRSGFGSHYFYKYFSKEQQKILKDIYFSKTRGHFYRKYIQHNDRDGDLYKNDDSQ